MSRTPKSKRTPRQTSKSSLPEKYALYEASVQSPEPHVDLLERIYKELRGKPAQRLREDFCGTFALSAEWVKRGGERWALGLDLDPEPLAYGEKNHRRNLTSDQKRRLVVRRHSVLSVTSPKADIVVAPNFSFFIFKKREELRRYFEFCRKALAKDGVLVLEAAGGPGMARACRETKTVQVPKIGKFRYIWHQKKFDPITHDSLYAIHFEFPDGRKLKDAFTYDWRLWSIPEMREILKEAGFKETAVYWEAEHKGSGTGEYLRTEGADNPFAWIAQIIGIK